MLLLQMASTVAGPFRCTGGGTGISRSGRPVGPSEDLPFVRPAPLSTASGSPSILIVSWSRFAAADLAETDLADGSGVDMARKLLVRRVFGSLFRQSFVAKAARRQRKH